MNVSLSNSQSTSHNRRRRESETESTQPKNTKKEIRIEAGRWSKS